MNRILFALAALAALFVLPDNSYACGRGKCGCAVARTCAAPIAAPRVSLSDRFAKLRAERAATGAAFRASLALMFARAPRPAVVAAPARSCGLFSRVARAAPVAAAPRRSCGLFTRVAAAPTRVAGCLHRARCAR